MSQQPGDKPSNADMQSSLSDALPDGQERVLPVIEEQLDVRKVTVETGAVRVRKIVHEETRTVDTPLVHEEVSITRVPVNRVVEDKFHSRQEGDTLVIPVFKEVITRHLVLLEEVRITTRRVAEQGAYDVSVKREEAVVERYDAETGVWKPDPAR
jgi:uncharacterized protein (TIGR02271 family)